MSIKVGTRLKDVLEAAHFVVTVEVGPPMGSNPDVIVKRPPCLVMSLMPKM